MGNVLANFEGLIRGAIAAKQAVTPEARQEVYQSSRNALSRLIETNRDLTVESAMQEQKALEEAIIRIETELNRAAIAGAPEPAPVAAAQEEYRSIQQEFGDQVPAEEVISNEGLQTGFSAVNPEPSADIESHSLPPEQPFSGSLPELSVDESPELRAPSPEIQLENTQSSGAEVELPSLYDDDDPLAELKEILLEDADESVRSSLMPEDSMAAPTPEASPEIPAPSVEPAAEEAPNVTVAPEKPQEASAQVTETGDSNLTESVAADAYGETPIVEDKENMPLEFARRRRKQKFFGWALATIVVLALIAWLAYYIYMGVVNGTLFGLNSTPPQNPNAPSNQAASADYITIVEPGDLSALVTANRGQAEIVNELNLEMVRLVSVRSDADRTQAAKPILLRLKPGVLEQISGKNVTFEIYAKSASPSPAQFTVKCEFGSLGSCGRKRFRVGLQPEASIFAFELGEVANPDLQAYIAISTDTTAAASATGRGDVIDLVYARLRANN